VPSHRKKAAGTGAGAVANEEAWDRTIELDRHGKRKQSRALSRGTKGEKRERQGRLEGKAEEEGADRQRTEARQAALDGEARAVGRCGEIKSVEVVSVEVLLRETYAEPGEAAAAPLAVELPVLELPADEPGLSWVVEVVWTMRPSIV
jgi:hypothetical protein